MFGGSPKIAMVGLTALALLAVFLPARSQAAVSKFPATPAMGTHATEGIAVGTGGDLFVAVHGQGPGVVRRFTSAGAFVGEWPTGAGAPRGIATDTSGAVYVTSSGGSTVRKFDAAGTLLDEVPAVTTTASGVAVAPSGTVYLAKPDQCLIQRLDPALDPIDSWGSCGAAPGQFGASSLLGVAVGQGGDVFVTDQGNSRVQRFTATGTYLGQWGGPGAGAGQFTLFGGSEFGVDAESTGEIVVSDASLTGRIQRFSAPGAFLGSLGLAGGSVRDLATATGGVVYASASDRFIYRVEPTLEAILKMDHPPPPPPPARQPPPPPVVPTPVASERAYLNASKSEETLGQITRFEWDLDGDSVFEHDTGTVGTTSRLFGSVGTFPVSVRVTGTRGGSAVATLPLVVDPAPPPTLVAKPSDVAVGESVALDASESRGTIERFEWDLQGDGVFERDTGSTPTTTATFPKVGPVTVSVRVTRVGGTSGITSTTIAVRPTGRVGVSINSGAQFTNSPNVSVRLVWPTSATFALISNDGGFDPASERPVTPNLAWKLESSGPERLPKTVYVRFYAGAPISGGKWLGGTTFQDDIILDETPPKVVSAEVSPTVGAGAASFALPAFVEAASKMRTYRIRLKATDNVSGVAQFQLTSSRARSGALQKYRAEGTIKARTTPRWIRVKDRAGNWSRWKAVRTR